MQTFRNMMNPLTSIAVVDDHIPFRKGLVLLINLFKECQILFEADHGQEMVEKIRPDCPPDIILLDILMPVMDGFETASWLRTNYPEVKILALSTIESEEVILKMKERGARGYLLKGADVDELKAALDKLLRGELHFPRAVLEQGDKGCLP
jgi:DNA-binding NarL/FixJ family response regulator